MPHTITELLAIEGLSKTDTFDTTQLQSVLTPYSATSMVSIAQTAIFDAAGLSSTPMDRIGEGSLPVFTGVIPTGFSSNDNNDTAGSINAQALTYLFAGDAGKLSRLISLSKTYSDGAADLMGAVDVAKTKSFSDFGIGGTIYSDIVGNGVDSLVNDVTKIDELADALLRFGTLFDYDELETLGTARNMAQVLIDNYNTDVMRGLFIIHDVDLDNLDDVDNERKLLRAFKTITGSQLAEIAVVFDATFIDTVVTLADTLDVALMFADVAKFITFLTFTELFTTLQFFPGITTLGSGQSVATLLKSMDFSKFTILDTLSKPLPDATAAALLAEVGAGTGAFGQVTTNDIIGSLAAITYDVQVPIAIAELNKLDSAATIQLFQDVIDIMDDTVFVPDKDVAVSAIAITIESNLTSLAATTAGIAATAAYDLMITQLTDEPILQGLADITIGTIGADSVIRFGNALNQYALDTQLDFLLRTIAANNQSGESVVAALTDAQNIKDLEVANLKSPNQISH